MSLAATVTLSARTPCSRSTWTNSDTPVPHGRPLCAAHIRARQALRAYRRAMQPSRSLACQHRALLTSRVGDPAPCCWRDTTRLYGVIRLARDAGYPAARQNRGRRCGPAAPLPSSLWRPRLRTLERRPRLCSATPATAPRHPSAHCGRSPRQTAIPHRIIAVAAICQNPKPAEAAYVPRQVRVGRVSRSPQVTLRRRPCRLADWRGSAPRSPTLPQLQHHPPPHLAGENLRRQRHRRRRRAASPSWPRAWPCRDRAPAAPRPRRAPPSAPSPNRRRRASRRAG